LNKETIGCTEKKEGTHITECCKAEIATCLACGNRVTIEDICLYKPETVGCPKKKDPKDDDANKDCCEAVTSECEACKAKVTQQQYC